ncbi:hypothetical protein [Estrella lausannensis]|uniref:Putative membrane protein n=1 Tax=Estrella lausannensis TaxID=483423 RepID=A0A0H5DN24_9BACT|nr:hypothetical protein [Estrella lausannensis]CRX37616.1 putative membrane protein [Estrella lausannensis]
MLVNSVCTFFFHPLNERHSLPVKVMSVITMVALSILTAGIYLAVFACVNLAESRSISHLPMHTKPMLPLGAATGFVGTEELKRKQKSHLMKLEALAAKGEWQHLREHTAHRDSGFDWWMFPTDRSSAGQGDKYQLGKEDIAKLKADPEFMESYRNGVRLVLLSWGWDSSYDTSVQNSKQRWTNYQVRLGKMAHSLFLFEEKALLQSIQKFCDERGITPHLEPWIRKYIASASKFGIGQGERVF